MSFQIHHSEAAPTSEPTGWGEWDAAVFLLRAPLLIDRTEQFIDEARCTIDWEGIDAKACVWSSAEQMLVALAQNLWTGSGEMNVNSLLTTLDNQNFELVSRALELRRGGSAAVELQLRGAGAAEVESRLQAFLDWLIGGFHRGEDPTASQASKKAEEYGLEGEPGSFGYRGTGSVRALSLWDCVTPPQPDRLLMETHRLGLVVWGSFPSGETFYPAFYRFDFALSHGG